MAREKPGPSVLNPVMEPSFWKTSVLTDPVARDRASVSSHSAQAACLWGTVTLAPMNPLSLIRRTTSANSSGDA